MADKKDARKLPALVAGIKLEPGTFDVPPGRLPSFGGRRDLTLGSSGAGKIGHGLEAKPKRIYTPNLNVQRNKNKSDAVIKEEHPNSKDKRDRNKNDGKGRKRDKTNNFIQSGGVFSEGVAGKTKVSGGRGGGGGGGGDRDPSNNFIQKPKLNLQHDKKIDKEEEEMKLKELLRDNFLDDPGMEPDATNAPVKLPMLSVGKIKFEVKTEIKEEMESTKKQIAGVKIKQEKLDEDEKDVKSKLENGLVQSDTDTGAETVRMKLPEGIKVHELFENKDPQIIFLQMPDCLPGLKPEEERVPARPSTAAAKPSSSTEQSNSTSSTENAEAPKHCTLKSLPEGCVGKLQVLKSGRARLIFGDVVMNLDMGTQVGFRQDLVSVDLDHSSRGGDMINLGPVKARLVCTPDWETMLS